ncbi:RRP15-like protein [Pseudoscourfieldia marina]
MPRGWGSEGGRATLASRNSNLGKRKGPLGGRGGGGGGGGGGVARRRGRGDSAGDVEGNPGRVLDADADADDDLEFDADVDDSDDEEEDGDSSDGDEYDDDDDDDLFGDDDDDDDGELDDSEEDDEPGNNNNAKAVAKNTSSADAFTRAFQKAEKLANKGKKKSANQTIQPQEDDILDASKVVARRRAEAKALKVSRSERRKEKLALKQQCRVYPTIKGETPDEDAREKKLARLATRGVVRLFNAVRAAQKAEEGADVGKARAAKQGLVRSLEGTAVAPKVRSKAGGGGGAATSSKWGVLSGTGVVENGKGMRMRQWDDTTLPAAEADVADDVAPPESLFD